MRRNLKLKPSAIQNILKTHLGSIFHEEHDARGFKSGFSAIFLQFQEIISKTECWHCSQSVQKARNKKKMKTVQLVDSIKWPRSIGNAKNEFNTSELSSNHCVRDQPLQIHKKFNLLSLFPQNPCGGDVFKDENHHLSQH